MIKIKKTDCIVAVFDDDTTLLGALTKAREKGFNILDCFTPFPVHGIEKVLGIKRSNLAVAAFAFGSFGFLLALTMMTYTMTFDWPEDIGGKPTWPLTSMVPILFELTVLCTAFGMTITFFWTCKLMPGVIPVIYDKRSTDDHFVVLFAKDKREAEVRETMQQNGVKEMKEDQYITHNFPGPLPIKLR